MDGKRILVVEDEALLALDLRFTLEDLGARVIGPCYRLDKALRVASTEAVDAAILDVDIAGEVVFPLADLLTRADVPFVFHTGRYDQKALAERYSAAVICSKPTAPEHLAQVLGQLIGQRPN